MENVCLYDSPLGTVILRSDGDALTYLGFTEETSSFGFETEDEILLSALKWLDIYFSGAVPDFTPPLKARSTPFREMVWEELLTIPYGKTASYGRIAKRIEERTGRRCSARAVGGAVGANPISLIIPCHRVIGTDGSLTGFGWGLERKRKLLALEGSWEEGGDHDDV